MLIAQELRSLEIPPEERRAMLEARAVELRNRREAERKRLADELLFQRWREGCDAVRTLDSKHLTMSAVNGRWG